MAKSHFTDGCPIATTLLETVPQAPSIRAAGAKALADWAQIFSLALQAHAVTEVRAARLAAMAVAAIEGALLQARVAGDQQALLDVGEEVALAFESAIARAKSA